MKLLFVALALLVAVVTAQYTTVQQISCETSNCQQGCQSANLPTNQCLQTTSPGLYIVGNCTTNGAQFTEYVYEDSSCTSLLTQSPIPTKTCEQVRGGGYAEWLCLKNKATTVQKVAPAPYKLK